METIIDRLKQFIEAYGLNNNSLTVKAGLSVGLLGQALKNKKGLHSDTIQKILNTYPEISAEWFVMGRGSMQRSHSESHALGEGFKETPSDTAQMLEAAREAGRQAAREEFQALHQRKRTSPITVAATSHNGDGATIKKS